MDGPRREVVVVVEGGGRETGIWRQISERERRKRRNPGNTTHHHHHRPTDVQHPFPVPLYHCMIIINYARIARNSLKLFCARPINTVILRTNYKTDKDVERGNLFDQQCWLGGRRSK